LACRWAGFAVAAETTNVVDRAVELGSQTERLGLESVWFAQMASYDALAVASAAGRAVPRISVGTAVVPIAPSYKPGQARTQAQRNGTPPGWPSGRVQAPM
jgi:alkanesulfonate monooxygenase SsuD/methylene tetrahydromethanopterin reductase-like flavin-dependent oxidoreductase (luciferase family)